jgi:predicted amidohydrolase YtcJ
MADFVVWDEDLTTIDPERLDQAKVLGTWLGGRKVFG